MPTLLLAMLLSVPRLWLCVPMNSCANPLTAVDARCCCWLCPSCPSEADWPRICPDSLMTCPDCLWTSPNFLCDFLKGKRTRLFRLESFCLSCVEALTTFISSRNSKKTQILREVLEARRKWRTRNALTLIRCVQTSGETGAQTGTRAVCVAVLTLGTARRTGFPRHRRRRLFTEKHNVI